MKNTIRFDNCFHKKRNLVNENSKKRSSLQYQSVMTMKNVVYPVLVIKTAMHCSHIYDIDLWFPVTILKLGQLCFRIRLKIKYRNLFAIYFSHTFIWKFYLQPCNQKIIQHKLKLRLLLLLIVKNIDYCTIY